MNTTAIARNHRSAVLGGLGNDPQFAGTVKPGHCIDLTPRLAAKGMR